MTMHFVIERETSGAIRYKQITSDGKDYGIADGAEIGSLYMRKSAFKNGAPKRITVEVKEG